MSQNTSRPGQSQPRPRTINSKGEIVERPYGPSRWATPKKYGCLHGDCTRPATILTPAGSHPDGADLAAKAHNCCGHH